MTKRSSPPARGSAAAAPRSLAGFVEQIAVLLESDGLPRIAGRLFGLLLISPEAQSLDDIAATLGVSKPSISVNARLLEDKGVVERVSRPGDRRDYYQISDDILERTLEQRIARWRRFHELVAGARHRCAIPDATVRARLEAMDHIYRHMLDATTGALDQWRARHGGRGHPDTDR